MAEDQDTNTEHDEDLAVTEEESEGVSGGHAKNQHHAKGEQQSMYGPDAVVIDHEHK